MPTEEYSSRIWSIPEFSIRMQKYNFYEAQYALGLTTNVCPNNLKQWSWFVYFVYWRSAEPDLTFPRRFKLRYAEIIIEKSEINFCYYCYDNCYYCRCCCCCGSYCDSNYLIFPLVTVGWLDDLYLGVWSIFPWRWEPSGASSGQGLSKKQVSPSSSTKELYGTLAVLLHAGPLHGDQWDSAGRISTGLQAAAAVLVAWCEWQTEKGVDAQDGHRAQTLRVQSQGLETGEERNIFALSMGAHLLMKETNRLTKKVIFYLNLNYWLSKVV